MSAVRRLLSINPSKLNFRVAAYVLLAVVLAVALTAFVGAGAFAVGIAAVLVALVGRAGSLRARVVHMGVVTLVGGVFGFLSYASAETAWQAALVLAAVGYLTGLAYRFGPAAGRAGYLLLIWALIVLIGESRAEEPAVTAVAFLLGGAVAMIVTAVVTAIGRRHGHTDPLPVDDESVPGAVASKPTVGAVMRSDLGVYCALRAVLVFVAVLIGYRLTTDGIDPYWTPIVVFIVFLPDRHLALFKGTQRVVGTLLGAAVTTVILEFAGIEALIVVLMVIAVFGAVVFYSANYLIYAVFLTSAVLMYYWFDSDHQLSSAPLRVLATLIGAGLAFTGVGLMALRSRKAQESREQ